MNDKYFNILPESQFNNSTESLIRKLVENDVFHLKKEDLNCLMGWVKELRKTKMSELDILNSILYFDLDYNREVLDCLTKRIVLLLKETDDQLVFPMVYFMHQKYFGRLNALVSDDLRIKLINKTMKKVVKKINKICQSELQDLFLFPKLYKEDFYTLVKDYYLKSDPDGITKTVIISDVFKHVKPYTNSIMSYSTGQSFFKIQSLIKFTNIINEDLKILEKRILEKKSFGEPNCKAENLKENYNRAPLVFNKPYFCELFVYALMHEDITRRIIFSYYFWIFKRQKYFRENIKLKDYLNFINKLYGLNEIRVREYEISSKIEDKMVKRLIDLEKSFDKEIVYKQ